MITSGSGLNLCLKPRRSLQINANSHVLIQGCAPAASVSPVAPVAPVAPSASASALGATLSFSACGSYLASNLHIRKTFLLVKCQFNMREVVLSACKIRLRKTQVYIVLVFHLGNCVWGKLRLVKPHIQFVGGINN